MAMAVSIGADTVSVYNDGEYYQVDKSHPNYTRLLEELRKQPRDVPTILQLVEIPRFVALYTAGRVQMSEHAVLFDGEQVGGYMVDRLLNMLAAGDEVTGWALWMDSLMDNPNADVREDLFRWMERGGMPITPDGCIIAFKKVRQDYTDVHTGRFSNKPGSVLEMDRKLCDPSRHNTCSTGFHFCSADYLRNFSGERVVVVKINPRDVTAIPKDYGLTKGRCCKYTVTGELTSESAARHKVWSEKNVVSLEDSAELPDVLVPRTAPKDVQPDPARASGPAPVDDLAPGRPKASKSKSKTPKPKASAVKPTPGQSDFKSRGLTYSAAEIAETVAASTGVTAAAKALGVPISTFLGWVTKLGLQPAKAPAAAVKAPAAKAPAPAEAVFKSKNATLAAGQVRAALTAAGGKYSVAAKALGVPESTLKGWAKKLNS